MDLTPIAHECRRNSERWFPALHANEDMTVFYSLALAGEVGEMCNLIKKYIRSGWLPATESRSGLADIFTYLLLLADELHIDLIHALQEKQLVCEERWENNG